MDVQFKEEQTLPKKHSELYRGEKKGMVDLVIRAGFASDRQGAEMILLVGAILIFFAAGFIFLKLDESSKPYPPSPLPDPVVALDFLYV
jgi:hypothetical protein